jgi:hypothetical protein
MTAIEWLIEQMLINNYTSKQQIENAHWLLNEAKEIEKQQMKGMYIEGSFAMMRKFDGKEFLTADDYISKTYGSKGSDELGSSLEWNGEVTEGHNIHTSSQTETPEHKFTEKDIRFAYMQGYNRGVDGNPNHMESYIEHLQK